jgi:fatty acid desaturase/predicted heme/steroid binding protein
MDQKKKLITFEEVRQHDQPDDAWMIFRNKVYDVSRWTDHPGGNVIFSHAGMDCTDVFASFHPASSHAIMKQFYIGELDVASMNKSEEQENFESSYRRMIIQLQKQGMFDAQPLYYVRKMLEVCSILGLATYLVANFTHPLVRFLACFLVALFWQQCGWLSHDFLHHQVFKNRLYGDIFGLITGNLFQGFSVDWWKNKHNTHHATPNTTHTGGEAHNGDPDIDTLPFLAWSRSMVKDAEKMSSFARFCVRNQKVLYFPILLLARFSWTFQSIFYALNLKSPWETDLEGRRRDVTYKKSELALFAVHYAYFGWLCFYLMSPGEGVLFYCGAQAICGLLLALVFGLGHNGMAVYPSKDKPDYWTLQVSTTRDVKGSQYIPQGVVDWFMGGLQHQVEHHLFLSMPRHNLGKAFKAVRAFCSEHNLHHHTTTMLQGTSEILEHLHRMGELLEGPIW